MRTHGRCAWHRAGVAGALRSRRPGAARALPAPLPFLTVLLVGVLLVGSGPLHGQVIPIKTVPVASGDQFLLFPSANLAMGGVGLAVPDTLGEVFSNPAAGGRITESFFFSSPTYYRVSDRNGSGRTLPLGTFFTSGRWFGGGAVSIQELKGARRELWPIVSFSSFWPPSPTLSEASARNLYALGTVGYRFPELGLSVGVSGFWAELGAVDGVDLLYAMSQEIDQSGHLSDLRLGILKEWGAGRSLELLLLKSRLRMTHEVTYLDLVWEPLPGEDIPVPQWRTRLEKNLDHTDNLGAHLVFRRPLGQEGWRMGWSLTANRKDHPKIPNYEIQNIPRDPGDTRAYALGVGVAKVEGPIRLGADLILEPIRSDTWADLPTDTVSVHGTPIPAGAKTVENEFTFTNALIRAGGSWSHEWVTLRAGVQVRSISYELDQFDRIQATKRTQDESWMEWTPSLGVTFDLKGATVHLTSRTTTGTGRPGTRWTDARMEAFAGSVDFANDVLLAPQGPLTLQDARVTTHQLSVVIPIR